MIRYLLTAAAALLTALPAFPQWHATFDHPADLNAWQGDTDAFRISSGWLQLDDDTPSRTAVIRRPITLTDTTEWHITIRMPFAPSNANHARIYLFADSTDIPAARGYYLQLGRNGAADAIELHRQTPPTDTLLGRGPDSAIAGGLADVRIVIRYAHPGRWMVTTHDTLPHTFSADDTFTDRQGFFGIYCRHTSSRRQSFFFDDIYVGPPLLDTTAPGLIDAASLDSLSVRLRFNETIAAGAPTDTHRFALRPVAPIQSVTWADSAVLLHLSAPLTPRQTYTAFAYHIADTSGNIRPQDSSRFLYYVPQWGDLRINEIMADPEPPVGLPNAEYVEIFNATPWPLPLQGWQLSDPSRTASLPADTLPPGAFAILTSAPDAFSGPVIGLTHMPTLNNSSDRLILRAPDSTLIDTLTYAATWHTPAKQTGGWALERIFPYNDCAGPENWTSATAPAGGTPGAINSVFDPNHDTVPPRVTAAAFDASNRIVLTFSERIFRTAGFRIAGTPALPPLTDSLSSDRRTLLLLLQGSLPGNVDYHLTVDSIADCWGNVGRAAATVRRPAPVPSFPFAVRINELMPDPEPPVMLPAAEYVELYNRTDDTLELWQWTLSDGSRTAVFPPYRMAPKDFLLLVNPSDSTAWRKAGIPFLPLSGFPSLNNEADSLLLSDPIGTVIDAVTYGPSWYARNPLKADGGWAFELQNPDFRCRTIDNWHFSQAFEGGTPAMPNTFTGITDTTPPMPMGVSIIDSVTIRIQFSEPIVPELLRPPISYVLDDGNHPIAVIPEERFYQSVQLQLPVPLRTGQPRVIHFPRLKDCADHSIQPDSILFGIPRLPRPGQLVISEMLPDPDTPDAEFIEIYNATDSLLSVKNLLLYRLDRASGGPVIFLDRHGTVMPPHAYWVVARSAAAVRAHYAVPRPDWLFSDGTVALPNDSAVWGLLTRWGDTLDIARYHIQRQRPPFISDATGFSLERLSPALPGDQLESWRLAASTVRATPTGPNSQQLPRPESTSPRPAWLEYYTLTPDGDGDRDLLRIHYQLDAPGFLATLTILNRQGQVIFQQHTPHYLSPAGTIEWTPQTRRHQPLRPGLYLGVWEYYHPTLGRHGTLRFAFSIVGS